MHYAMLPNNMKLVNGPLIVDYCISYLYSGDGHLVSPLAAQCVICGITFPSMTHKSNRHTACNITVVSLL